MQQGWRRLALLLLLGQRASSHPSRRLGATLDALGLGGEGEGNDNTEQQQVGVGIGRAEVRGSSSEIPQGGDNTEPTRVSALSLNMDSVATPEEEDPIVQMSISVDMTEDNLPITAGDVEMWVCYLNALVAKKLAYTSSNQHVVVLMAHPNALDYEAKTITIQAVSRNHPDDLLADLRRTTDANALNQWFSRDLPETNALYNATVKEWETTLAQATIASDPHDQSFSTADCGIARVSMMFGFFDALTVNTQDFEEVQLYEQDVQNLMCSSDDFFTVLFGQLETGIDITMDRVLWELDGDPDNPNPLTVHFDLRGSEVETKRLVPPVALLEWLAESDMTYYIQQAVWTALPYKENIFSDTNGVFFTAKVRYEGEETPAQTMSTLDCVEGIYVPESDQEKEDTDPTIVQVTSWTLHFGYEQGFSETEPTEEEIDGLFCQTYFYYKDMLRPSTPNHPIVYTNLSMEVYEYTYTPSDEKPFILYLEAQAWSPTGARVDPQVLRGQMEQSFDINTYITDYVWKSEPVQENVMYHTATVHVDSGVRERHEANMRADYNSTNCFRITEAPSEMPTDMPSLEPTTGPTVVPTIAPTTTEDEEGEISPSGGGGIGGLGGGIGGIGGGFGGGNNGANGGVNNGPQELGSNGFAELGGGTLGERPAAMDSEEEGDEEEDGGAGISGAIGGGTGGGIGSGIGGGIGGEEQQEEEGYEDEDEGPGSSGGMGGGIGGGIGSGIGGSVGGIGGIGGGFGGGSMPSNSNGGAAMDNNKVTIDTSFVAIHLPSIPLSAVSDGPSFMDQALADMLQDMIANKPRPGTEQPPPERRRLVTETELDRDSMQTGNVTNVDCTDYYDVDAYADDMDCSHVDVQFDVNVTGAESQEDLEAVKADYKNMTDTGIENGQFQQALDDIDPDSGLLLVSDKENQHALAGDDRDEPQPETDAPAAESPTFQVPEPEQPPPQTNNTDAPKPEDEDDDKGSKNPPLWGMIVCMLILFILGIVTGMNLRHCTRPREPRGSSLETDERLLT